MNDDAVERPISDELGRNHVVFEPPVTHKAADRAGKTLGNMAGSINKVLDADADPVVLNRKGPHVSIKSLEDLIASALAESAPPAPDAPDAPDAPNAQSEG